MRTTEEFLSKIMYNYELNKEQLALLDFGYPPEENWDNNIIDKELSTRTYNLLVLLRGEMTLETQKQIIDNYDMLAQLVQSSKVKKTETIKNEKKDDNKQLNKLIIYCDGACKKNPGEAGSGIAVYRDDEKPVLYYGDYVAKGTNNIAELNALYKALEIASDSNLKKTTIYSDSKYSIDCITTWAYGWKSNGWTKRGGEIKNLALIKKTHTLYNNIKKQVIIKHVKAHAGIEGNELADRMAVLTIVEKSEKYTEHKYIEVDSVLKINSY